MSQARRQRRELARKLGYIKKNESFKDMLERTRRAKEVGDQIHIKNLERNKNLQVLAEESKKDLKMRGFVEDQKKKREQEEFGYRHSNIFDFLKNDKDREEGPYSSNMSSVDE